MAAIASENFSGLKETGIAVRSATVMRWRRDNFERLETAIFIIIYLYRSMNTFYTMNKKLINNRHDSNNNTVNARTTVTLKNTTIERLIRYGEFGDSWDSLINKILDKLTDCEKK
jgi:hypothetical protein